MKKASDFQNIGYLYSFHCFISLFLICIDKSTAEPILYLDLVLLFCSENLVSSNELIKVKLPP